MSTNKIAKAINESCKDDKVMRSLLLDILDYHMKGKSWYKDEYRVILEKHIEEASDEN